MSSNSDPKGSLIRGTNWWGAFVVGLAGTILVTGIAPLAVKNMGAASIPFFVLVTLAGVLLCLCLAELAAMMPHRTGGLPAYAYETYKCFGSGTARQVGGISAWAYCLGWFPVAPINMILAAKYITKLWELDPGPEYKPISAPIDQTVLVIAILGMLILFIPCYRGIRLGTGFATMLGIVSMVPITLLVFLPFFKPETLYWARVFRFVLPDPGEGTFSFYMGWIFLMTWSVLGIEAAACYIGECRNPARDAKIAMTASGLYGGFIYFSVPVMLMAVLGSNLEDDPFTAFLEYTQVIFGEHTWVRWLIGIPLIVALLLSVLNAIMGCGRSLYQVAHDGLLPRVFEHTNRHGVPGFAVAFNLVCSIIVVLFGSPVHIYILSNTGYLLALALAYIGYYLHREFRPQLLRPVRLPGAARYLALAVGLFFLFVWAYGGYYSTEIKAYATEMKEVGGKRWLFFLGLGVILLYVPLYAYRRFVEDRAKS